MYNPKGGDPLLEQEFYLTQGPLFMTLGACQEAADSERKNYTLLKPPSSGGMCGGDLTQVAYILDLLIVLVFVAFLVRIRYLMKKVAKDEDTSMWTTADYSVFPNWGSNIRQSCRIHPCSGPHTSGTHVGTAVAEGAQDGGGPRQAARIIVRTPDRST